MTSAVRPPEVTAEIAQWTPLQELSEQERQIVERMSRNKALEINKVANFIYRAEASIDSSNRHEKHHAAALISVSFLPSLS